MLVGGQQHNALRIKRSTHLGKLFAIKDKPYTETKNDTYHPMLLRLCQTSFVSDFMIIIFNAI